MERQPSITSLDFGCCGNLNLFGKKRRQKQLREMANLEALCRERIRVDRDLEQMKLELEKKKKQERKKLVKQRKLQKAEKKIEKREMDWLHWITTKCLITRREERQELERLRDLDVQLQLKDLRDLERQTEEQKRIEIMERKHQKASRKGWTEHYSKYRVDRLEDMERRRDNEDLGDSLTDEDLVRELTSLKESFAQQDRERGKWDECQIEKIMLTMLQETEIEEELRREKRKLQVSSMHKGKSKETQLQTNVERTQMQPKMEEDRLLVHLKESDTKRWKDKCKKLERLLATEREVAEVREMATLEEMKRKRESEKLDLSQLMKRQRQMEKILEEKIKAFEMEREKLNELLREQEVRQKEMKFGLVDLETKKEDKRGDSKNQEHVTHHRWLEMEEKDQRTKESLQEIKQIEHEQLIETDEGQQEIQKMQKAGQKLVEKSREIRLEMETTRETERQISEAREKAKRETEIQTEKQTEIKTQQEKRQRKQEMEKQREEEEFKRNLEMLKTRMRYEEQEYKEMHRVIQKEIEKENLKKEPKDSEREKEMENEKMAKNGAIKEKCKWIEMQFDKERQVVEERAMALLEKRERTGESNRQDMDRQKMENDRQIGGELQINNTKTEREKQKVTEQKEKQRKVEENFWDTANLAKSEEVKKLSPKNEESFEIDLELQSQMDERNQRKEVMLLETEKQRDEEPMKERQARQLKIQQMQEARQKHAERQTKRKRELMLKLFSQRMSPVNKEHQQEHQQESSEPEQKHQEQVRFQRPVSSSGVWLINIKPLESSEGPAEQQLKSDQLSTSAPETQPEESVRDESSNDPEDPEPQALTQPRTVEEQSLEISVPTDGSEDSGEMAVEMKDVTSQDTESEKRDGPKHKSIRRRIFGWINKKLKESHENAIAKSIEIEKKHGDRRYLMRNTRQWTTEAAIQQQKREELQKKEKKREAFEARWRAWEEKRAKKKEEKKEEENRKAEEEHEIPHLKTYAYCYIR